MRGDDNAAADSIPVNPYLNCLSPGIYYLIDSYHFSSGEVRARGDQQGLSTDANRGVPGVDDMRCA
jgi:hypothetical protein